jgi:hypothetical protein
MDNVWEEIEVDQKHTTVHKADNTMANRRRQTTQWPTEEGRQHNGQQKKADNTMANRRRLIT